MKLYKYSYHIRGLTNNQILIRINYDYYECKKYY